MRRPRLWLLIVAGALAVAVDVLGVVGTWAWDSTARQLRVDATAGANALLDAPLLKLPAAVLRSRRLVVADLVTVEQDLAVKVLEAVAHRQIRCMVVYPDGYLNLARARLLRNQVFEGQEDLTEALRRDPTRPFSIRLLALVTLFHGHFEKAMDLLAQAEAVAPGYRVPVIEMSSVDEARIRLDGLERRLEIYPRVRAETLISIGQLLRAMGRVEEAQCRLEEAAGDPRVDLVRAQWALNDGDAATAAGLAQGLTLQRRLPAQSRASAWSIVAQALETQGDQEGALAAAHRSLRLAPDSAAPHLALARIAQGRGDIDGAVTHFRRAWGMDPANTGILFQFARAAEKAGLKADARLALERAVDLNPGDTSTVLRLVDFQLRNGDFMDAAMSLSRALDHDPTNSSLLKMGERLSREVKRR